MMGIYIKGMKMPPDGLQETVLLTHNKATINSNRAWKGYKEFEVVSVSSHGRLIDTSEKISVQIYDEQYDEWYNEEMTIDELLNQDWIEAEASTIIPASKEKDNE